jgi:hypothetical protein
MPNVVLSEGSLKFKFLDVDFVTRYDAWQHYRNQFQNICGGAKAIDFIAIKEKTVWLIEVKDYRVYPRTKSTELSNEIAMKVRDTLAGLVSTCYHGNNSEEAQQSKLALQQKKMRIVLHLEQGHSQSRLFSSSGRRGDIQLKLRQALRFADMHPIICNSEDFPANLGKVEKTKMANVAD